MRQLDRLVTSLVIATVAVSLLPQLAFSWWVFELFSHFRVQYFIALVVLAVVLSIRRRWLWCGVVLAGMALNAAPLAGYWPRLDAGTPAGEFLTLMSVNLNDGNRRHQDLVELVTDESPDLVLLVEFNDAWALGTKELVAEYPYRVEAPRRDAYGIALLSRHPFAEQRVFTLIATAAIDARIDLAGSSVRIIGVHLTSPTTAAWADERDRQLRALATLVREETGPLAVMGDFNATPYSPIFMAFLRSSGLRDARLSRGWGYSWPTFLPILGIPIDHCLVTESVAVIDHRRGAEFGSDHYPVIADLAVRTGT